MRAVLDPNVIISGVLAAGGTPAELLLACDRGEFELIASPSLLGELRRALNYPKLRQRIGRGDAEAILRWVSDVAVHVGDAAPPPGVRSADPGDDYLVGLAASQRAALVSGDKHLLDLSSEIPIFSPRRFLEVLPEQG